MIKVVEGLALVASTVQQAPPVTTAQLLQRRETITCHKNMTTLDGKQGKLSDTDEWVNDTLCQCYNVVSTAKTNLPHVNKWRCHQTQVELWLMAN